MNEDFLERLSSLLAAAPRATTELDVWIEATPLNAVCVLDALRPFGAPLGG